MRMIRKPSFVGISKKLFILNFISVIGVVSILSFFGYQRVFEPIRESNEEALQLSVVEVENYIKTLMNNIQSQLLFMSSYVIDGKVADNDYNSLMENVMSLHREEIEGFYYVQDGQIVSSAPFGYQFYVPAGQIQNIFEQTEKTGFWWSSPYAITDSQTISVAKRVDGHRMIVIDLNLSALAGPTIVQRRDQNIFLFTNKGEFITSNRKRSDYETNMEHGQMVVELQKLVSTSRSSFDQIHTSKATYRVLKSEQNRWNWVVLSVVKEEEAYPLIALLKQQLWFVLVMAVFLSAIVSVWIAKYIHKPVGVIIKQMKVGARGDLHARVLLKRNDEFSLISDGFNRMMDNIQLLFEDLKTAEEKKLHHELKVLQSQIHPHFLNNTLNAIYCLDEAGRASEMAAMIDSLMGMLQYSIDKVGDMVTLQDELAHLEHYVRLMKLRYGHKFEVDMVVPEWLLDVPIPKLTIITLVENSIFYGLRKRAVNHIIVTASSEAEKVVVIEVSDKGPGIDPAKFEQILAGNVATSSEKGLNNLGLRNIQERIQLYFGAEFGLRFYNEPGEGLLVSIRLPGLPSESEHSVTVNKEVSRLA